MTDRSPEFGYFASQGKLSAHREPDPQTYDAEGIDLELIIKAQAAQIGQSPLWLLIFEDFRVSWGYLDESGLHLKGGETLSAGYLQELRLFGPEGEFYLWREGEFFRSRLRLDPAGLPHWKGGQSEMQGYTPLGPELPDFSDEWQVLWGSWLDSQASEQSGWLEIYEQRGAHLALPHKVLNKKTEDELPLRLRVRHYIDYDPATGLAYYCDLRLVELSNAKFQPLGWI